MKISRLVAAALATTLLGGCGQTASPRATLAPRVNTPTAPSPVAATVPATRTKPAAVPLRTRPFRVSVAPRGSQGVLLGWGQVTTGDRIPWSQVGPGWRLGVVGQGQWDAQGMGRQLRSVMLDLIDPAGGRYQLLKTSASPGWQLADWSLDGRTALLVSSRRTPRAVAVDLRSGAQRVLALPHLADGALLRPGGRGLWLPALERGHVLRSVTWSGAVTHYDASGPALQAPDGSLVLGGKHGLTLLDPSGTQRALPQGRRCSPVRWWEHAVVLASCGRGSRLYTVPLSGGVRTAVSDPHGRNSGAYGDMDARIVGGVTYFQEAGACGDIYLARQNADGTLTRLDPPGAVGAITLLGATEGALVLSHEQACEGQVRSVLTAYDPVSNTERVLVRLPANEELGRVLTFGEAPRVDW